MVVIKDVESFSFVLASVMVREFRRTWPLLSGDSHLKTDESKSGDGVEVEEEERRMAEGMPIFKFQNFNFQNLSHFKIIKPYRGPH